MTEKCIDLQRCESGAGGYGAVPINNRELGLPPQLDYRDYPSVTVTSIDCEGAITGLTVVKVAK
jgi:hypothetical protein